MYDTYLFPCTKYSNEYLYKKISFHFLQLYKYKIEQRKYTHIK